MKNRLQIIIMVLILVFGLNVQSSEAKHKNKQTTHQKNNKKNYKKPGKKYNDKYSKRHNSSSYDYGGNYDGLGALIIPIVGAYSAVDSTDSGILDDSNERADRFIYSQIPAGSSEVEINNLFLSSLNPIKEYYEVNYIESSGIKKCFRIEESGVIRSIYKKMPCQ